ncbi:MAG: cytochrome c oxidase assembly protein [Rhodanobacteraceae bacterium]|nr:MAG: cytochrome c oxidase assembly protein [Rhodanobacteraceae bacterium]
MLDFLRWWIPWEPSASVVVAFALAVWLYTRGVRRSPMTAPWHRQVFFWLGMLVLYVGLHTQLDFYAEHEFFIHRIQHLGLHHLGPFLIVLAFPGVTMRRGLPVRWRTRYLRPVLAWAPVRAFFNVLLHPFVAGLLFVGLIYLWLWPAVHFDAMLDWRLYHIMNFSMAVDGLLFWWLVLDHRPHPPARLAPLMRIFLAFITIIPQLLIGAYIALTMKNLYPIYGLCGRAFAGIAPLTDQHLGGLVIWIPSGMMGVLGGLVAFSHWIRLDSKGRLPRNRRQRALLRARAATPQAQSAGPVELAGNTEKST